MSERVVGIVQARMGSTRLAGKVLRDMAGKPMLQRLLENLGSSHELDAIVVATSHKRVDNVIVDFCDQIGVSVYRGSEHDVLSRVVGAAREHGADIVVRLTGDNPLVTGDLLDLVVDQMSAAELYVDYAHTVDRTGWPQGMAVEAVRMSALNECLTSDIPADREHVTRFIRQRPERFGHLAVLAEGQLDSLSVTVDTAENFAHVARIAQRLDLLHRGISYQDVTRAVLEFKEP